MTPTQPVNNALENNNTQEPRPVALTSTLWKRWKTERDTFNTQFDDSNIYTV